MWPRKLTLAELADAFECQDTISEDILKWSKIAIRVSELGQGWSKVGATSGRMVETYTLCKPQPQVFIFPKVSAKVAQEICSSLGAEIPMPTTNKALHIIKKQKMQSSDRRLCNSMWIDLSDEIEESRWTGMRNSKLVFSIPWKRGFPNGDIIHNCVKLDINDGPGLQDTSCNQELCADCTVSQPAVWTMRGACQNIEHNRYFVSFQNEPGKLLFRGYGDYVIQNSSESTSIWQWSDELTGSIIAELSSETQTSKLWPQGRQLWLLKQNMCGLHTGQSIPLLLSPCTDGQFTCDDATCIDLYKRCDLSPDCKDGSDESGCNLIQLPPVYRGDISPQPHLSDEETMSYKLS